MPLNLGRNDWNWRSRKVQQQWLPPFKEVCTAWTTDHQHSIPFTNSQQDIMDAIRSKHWHLIDCHSAKKGQTGCQWQRLCGSDCLTDHMLVSKVNLRIQPARRPEGKKSAKETGCLQAETRQQEASIDQWYLRPFRCTGTQLRGCRWELNSLRDTVHSSAMDSLGPVSGTPRLVWWEWHRNPGKILEEKHQKHKAYLSDTSSVSSKTAYSNIC